MIIKSSYPNQKIASIISNNLILKGFSVIHKYTFDNKKHSLQLKVICKRGKEEKIVKKIMGL